jgi:hypothetical protein
MDRNSIRDVFNNALTRSYFQRRTDLPPVARAFVKNMKAFFAEKDRYKQNEIALRQLHALKEHQGHEKSRSGLAT